MQSGICFALSKGESLSPTLATSPFAMSAMPVASACKDHRIGLHAGITELASVQPITLPTSGLFSMNLIDNLHFSGQSDARQS